MSRRATRPTCGHADSDPRLVRNIRIPNVSFNVGGHPHIQLFCAGEMGVERVSLHCLRQFNVREEKVMKRLI
jgi:hypothetical protein